METLNKSPEDLAREALENEGGVMQPGQAAPALETLSEAELEKLTAPKKSMMEKIEPALEMLDVVAFSNLPEKAAKKFIGDSEKLKMFLTAISFYRDMRKDSVFKATLNG